MTNRAQKDAVYAVIASFLGWTLDPFATFRVVGRAFVRLRLPQYGLVECEPSAV